MAFSSKADGCGGDKTAQQCQQTAIRVNVYSAGDSTWGLTHARQQLYQWAAPPAIFYIYLFNV